MKCKSFFLPTAAIIFFFIIDISALFSTLSAASTISKSTFCFPKHLRRGLDRDVRVSNSLDGWSFLLPSSCTSLFLFRVSSRATVPGIESREGRKKTAAALNISMRWAKLVKKERKGKRKKASSSREERWFFKGMDIRVNEDEWRKPEERKNGPDAKNKPNLGYIFFCPRENSRAMREINNVQTQTHTSIWVKDVFARGRLYSWKESKSCGGEGKWFGRPSHLHVIWASSNICADRTNKMNEGQELEYRSTSYYLSLI